MPNIARSKKDFPDITPPSAGEWPCGILYLKLYRLINVYKTENVPVQGERG
jgi:hypothetical protein